MSLLIGLPVPEMRPPAPSGRRHAFSVTGVACPLLPESSNPLGLDMLRPCHSGRTYRHCGQVGHGAIRHERDDGAVRFAGRPASVGTPVDSFFELLPHFPVGVGEEQPIFGSAHFPTPGAGLAAVGLIPGLLVQGLFFASADRSQHGMNGTMPVMSLPALQATARRIIPGQAPRVGLACGRVVRPSRGFQAATVGRVLWRQGVSLATPGHTAGFVAACMSVILIGLLVHLAVSAVAGGGA